MNEYTYELEEWVVDEEKQAAAETLAELKWDTTTGVIRPRLILLAAYMKVGREMESEGQWGIDLMEELCDDDWATAVLVAARVEAEAARAYVVTEWK